MTFHSLILPEPMRMWRRLAFAALVALILLSAPFLWRAWIEYRFLPEIVTVENATPTRAAIVYGARVYGNGRLSAMVRDRVETGIALYEAGKVDVLLMSGSNQNDDYNEPGDMIAYAVQRGVPADALQPDYGGRRTYDTCYRAMEIFGVQEAILVTQEFHLPRALFTCRALGMQVQGVIADQREYSERSIRWSQMREIPATIVALFDVLRRQPATIMGERIPLQ
jgi:SanA protein